MLTSPPRKPALLVIFLETEICFSHSNRFPCIVITLWPHSIPCTAQLGGNGNSHIWWQSQVKGLQSLGIKTIQGFWAATKPDIHQPSCKSSSIECISCISSIFHILNAVELRKEPMLSGLSYSKCCSYLASVESKTSLILWGMWKADTCWKLNPGSLVWAIVHYYWAMTTRQQPALTILNAQCTCPV